MCSTTGRTHITRHMVPAWCGGGAWSSTPRYLSGERVVFPRARLPNANAHFPSSCAGQPSQTAAIPGPPQHATGARSLARAQASS
eukprot:scaffold518_cov388-Prasinococcus_capsulatus_cf.AAC.75